MNATNFTVWCQGNKKRTSFSVYAQFFVVKDGVLCFRNNPTSSMRYPETVRMFAAGYWLEVRSDS